MADTSSAQDFVAEERKRPIRPTQAAKVVLWLVLAAVVVIFAVVNTDKVRVDWLFGEADVWLWLIVGGSAVVGFLLGAFTVWRRS